jgi:hypothetical protein
LNAGVIGAGRPKEVNAFSIVTLVATLQKAWFCWVSKTLSKLNSGIVFVTFDRMRRPAVLFSGTTNSGRVYPRVPTTWAQSEEEEKHAINTEKRNATFSAIIGAAFAAGGRRPRNFSLNSTHREIRDDHVAWAIRLSRAAADVLSH